jgi:hypothetical protein
VWKRSPPNRTDSARICRIALTREGGDGSRLASAGAFKVIDMALLSVSFGSAFDPGDIAAHGTVAEHDPQISGRSLGGAKVQGSGLSEAPDRSLRSAVSIANRISSGNRSSNVDAALSNFRISSASSNRRFRPSEDAGKITASSSGIPRCLSPVDQARSPIARRRRLNPKASRPTATSSWKMCLFVLLMFEMKQLPQA